MTFRTNARRTRRGAALLIVLATLMVTMAAATILLSAAADVRLQRHLAEAELLADDALQAAEAPIQHWLDRESAKIVLPVDAAVPAITVVNDRWTFPRRHENDKQLEIELTITAFDQRGMVPMRLARSGSPLRLSLPSDVLAQLDMARLPPESDPAPLGLDLLTSDAEVGFDVFPRLPPSPVRRFGDASAEDEPTSAAPAPLAIGALVATHNFDPVRINANTAPMPLVEAALRLAGRGGLEQIVAARAAGKLTNPGERTNAARDSDDSAGSIPQIVASSDCWAFRIDVHVALLRRSWWAIYAPGRDDPNTPQRETWRCVQRLPITH
jgi:hypothetical protein